MSAEVLIVGAGPVGLTAALELARRGQQARIIEREPAPSTLSKAIGVNVRTLELLEPSGMTERLLAAGTRIYALSIRTPGRELLRVDLTKLRHRYNHMLALPQCETEALLADRLTEAGVAVERGVEFVGLEERDGKVHARLMRGDHVEETAASHVLGADGAHSAVRKSLGLDFPGTAYPEPWRLADVEMDGPFDPAEVVIFLLPSGLLFTIGMGEGRRRLASSGPDPLSLLPAEAVVRTVLWQSEFRISHRIVAQYQKGRVFLAGDAAHIHSPAGARGMNLGIEDAVTFAKQLAEDGLENYGTDRRAAGLHTVRFTDMQTRMMTTRNSLLRLLRNQVLFRLAGLEPFQANLRRELVGLGTP